MDIGLGPTPDITAYWHKAVNDLGKVQSSTCLSAATYEPMRYQARCRLTATNVLSVQTIAQNETVLPLI